MIFRDWLKELDYTLLQGSVDVETEDVIYDSRKAAPGKVFVAMKGIRVDGHSFIPQVLKAGVRVLVTERPVEEELKNSGVECILCQDDYICDEVVRKLARMGVRIPDQMKVASCHYSRILENYPITITSLKFNITELGRRSCQVLLDMIHGKTVPDKTLLDYEIILKESTKG